MSHNSPDDARSCVRHPKKNQIAMPSKHKNQGSVTWLPIVRPGTNAANAQRRLMQDDRIPQNLSSLPCRDPPLTNYSSGQHPARLEVEGCRAAKDRETNPVLLAHVEDEWVAPAPAPDHFVARRGQGRSPVLWEH